MGRRRRIAVAGIGLAILGGALWWYRAGTEPTNTGDRSGYGDATRNGLAMGPNIDRIEYLDQGWSPADSIDFYTRPQGSRLIPFDWFLALEQPDSEDLFRSNEHVARLGYLPQSPCASNPDGLPVGFVRDPDPDRADWLGLTCAACHTTEIHYGRVATRIDGGPTLGDFQEFHARLEAALTRTLAEPPRFHRFADRLRSTDRAALRGQLANAVRDRSQFSARNATPHPYGPGRLDAFGHIVNQVAVASFGGVDPGTLRPPDAPVSYPFLWDTPHHDFVQWNGIARNNVFGSERLGGLARNVGEVLGVFGEIRVSQPNSATVFTGYRSSVRIPDLLVLEDLVRRLQSPRWPANFPEIDRAQAEAGRIIYEARCASCHAPINRSDPARTVRAVKTPIRTVGTDPRMATNFATRRIRAGRLEGRREYFVSGDRFGPDAPADALVVHTILGVVLNSPWKQYTEASFREIHRGGSADPGGLLVYKARPLNGIWATAPYLHNGSVPNLYQLLRPARDRPTEYFVGSREFDPKDVGFTTEPQPGRFRFRTADPGNSNAGHEYGSDLTDDERRQLIEYLKTL